MHRTPVRYRFVFRATVRARREGGSISVTIPRYMVRRMGILPGEKLMARMTDEGIFLRPVWFRQDPPQNRPD